MGVSWQSADQKAFIEDYLPSFIQHSADGTAKGIFWPDFTKKWFEKWPVPEPAPDAINGSLVKAAERAKKIGVSGLHILTERADPNIRPAQQLKRVLKTAAASDDATGGRRDLRLEDPAPRKRSEVQVYMSLYYDTRIRPIVVKRWAETNIQNMDFSRTEIPEDLVDPEDSSLFKDTKIPLCYKNSIAKELYNAEEDQIKEAVRSKREADSLAKTVHNTNGEEKLDLVRTYQK